MDMGTVLSVAQTLFSALQCSELKKVLSILGYQSQPDELQQTVKTIQAVLGDGETKQELSQQHQNLIDKLKDAVFEADDLFDEFVTLAEQKKLLNPDSSLSKKLSNFFSRSKNPLSLAYRMSRGVKKIKKKLDAIASNQQFSFKIDPEPTRKRRPETCSYVNEVDIIGREDDLEYIVGMLLAPNDRSDVSVFSIVGIGGLGKTALAQLAYNDPRVVDSFTLRLWTCVSDENQKELDVKSILTKILASSTRTNPDHGSTMDQVQSQLRAQLAGKKYLLVLDDVWTENHHHWRQLVKYLIIEGVRGSRIVVTTRSQNTAIITGGQMHELSGLSEENSWRLFERTAFASDQPNPPDELVMIGQKIVHGCSGVPLAIRVAGSLLYGQGKNKWEYVQKIGLANIRDNSNDIMPILKLSYHHLEPPLKNCFRYCALFPKDYVIEKELLISLWMAQGFIVPLDKNQSIDDAGEEYFSTLLKRCFFQDIEYNEYGDIESCKIHNLMHDIAEIVSNKEMYALDSTEGRVDKNLRHLSILNMNEYDQYYSLGRTHIRSLLVYHCKDNFQLVVELLVGKFRYLRVLNLSRTNIKHLPDSIGELLHLRYIDLSENEDMGVLPNSITKLCNLQTLILFNCKSLKELPKDLSRLVKLRLLDIKQCYQLCWMPRGMGKLTCLNTLKGGYLVGGRGGCTSWKQWLNGLEDLKTLINLRGKLQIGMCWPKNAKNDVKEDKKEGLYLRSLKHLNHIELYIIVEDVIDEEDSGRVDEDEEELRMRVMEDLQPHSNLKSLTLCGYHGVKMPNWITATLLPHLVILLLYNCKELEYLPCLGNLSHLKYLHLEYFPKLEYIEEEGSRMLASTSISAQKVSLFPSLEQLYLEYLPKLKGWRKGVGMEESSNNSSSNKQCLSHLKELTIHDCPNFMCILVCPMLETLESIQSNERLQVCCSETDEQSSEAVVIQKPENSNTSVVVPKLREVTVSNGAWLNSMPMESFQSLQTLEIHSDFEMVELPNCLQYLSSLHTLKVYYCSNLKAVPNWMPKLASLKILTILGCSESLKKRCQKDPPGEDWLYIQHIPIINYTLW